MHQTVSCEKNIDMHTTKITVNNNGSLKIEGDLWNC
jgi:hypothetical protein